MSKTLIIAEKPSVAIDLARVLGAPDLPLALAEDATAIVVALVATK